MMYGLLGKKLSHSFSKLIHEKLQNDQSYHLIEKDSIDDFLTSPTFHGINVTIPYKQDVIPYIDHLDDISIQTNAVNTIINNNGTLHGYNTDYYGLEFLVSHNNISLQDKTVLILGNGSTSRTIQYLCQQKQAKKVYVIARNPNPNEYHFDAFRTLNNVEIIFNATPVGMFPNNEMSFPFTLDETHLEAVIDCVYNPLRTNLMIEAENKGIKAINGLLMLVYQAVKASELFHNTTYEMTTIEQIFKDLYLSQMNISLIGMPMSGKTHFTKLIAKQYNKELIEVDKEIPLVANKSIPDIFSEDGESVFRSIESEIISKFSRLQNKAISTGGGSILNQHNVDLLKQGGIIIFLDVPLSILKGFNPKNRPLLQNSSNLKQLFDERYSLYVAACDIRIIKKSLKEEVTLQKIEVKINEYIDSKWSQH